MTAYKILVLCARRADRYAQYRIFKAINHLRVANGQRKLARKHFERAIQ